MDITRLKFDRGCHKALEELEDGSVVAVKDLSIIIPKRFEDSRLAEVTDIVSTIYMLGLVVGDKYCFLGALASVVLFPGEIQEITINGDRFYQLDFLAGETVIENLTVPQDSNLSYYYYLEFIKYNRIPWYATFTQILSVFDEAKYYTGKSFGNSAQAVRVLYSLSARYEKNPNIPFRYSPDIDDPTKQPLIIGLNNPGQLLSSTFARMTSGYMNDNITAGLTNPDEKTTVLEEVYRGLPEEE